MADTVHFLIPLKARTVAHDWTETCALFWQTVTSIRAQTDPRFEIHVVCHDIPEAPPGLDPAGIVFHTLPVPPPVADADLMTRIYDKTLKIGYYFDRQFAGPVENDPAYVVFFDADDFVHSRLTSFLLEERPENGVYFPKGYFFDSSRRRIWLVDRFQVECGSCVALRVERDHVPDFETFRSLGVDEIGKRFFPAGRFHARWHEISAEKGRPLVALPFPGAVYRVNHGGNNHGARRIRFRQKYPFLFPAFKDQGGRTWRYERDTAGVLAEFGAAGTLAPAL